MRAFIILALAVTAMARPEAGYSYSQPSSSYGVPFGGHSLAGGVGGIGGISFGQPSGQRIAGGIGSAEGVLGTSSFNRIGSGSIASGIDAIGGVSGRINGVADTFASAKQIFRDVYVYGPSKDLEAPEVRGGAGGFAGYPSRPAQKHYKIVFIKAPTPPTPTAPVIPVQQQDEQKTLIYVLVKKPEEALEINLPTITPTQPSKPEVYFIKYKTQKEVTGTGPRPSTRYGVPGESGPY
ncbi:PREDICTED: uncharacterized protein LOC105622784 [Atta cephalotes]|uniref:DUF243 domain-containing protein n=1 Tax=Atta cephalotes TaxID=12957 RepID=A0A158NPY1_ATTCE|nr:PREDICTED: uncharacterized protein LOC105622784 [Atta cephalotes]